MEKYGFIKWVSHNELNIPLVMIWLLYYDVNSEADQYLQKSNKIHAREIQLQSQFQYTYLSLIYKLFDFWYTSKTKYKRMVCHSMCHLPDTFCSGTSRGKEEPANSGSPGKPPLKWSYVHMDHNLFSRWLLSLYTLLERQQTDIFVCWFTLTSVKWLN